MRICISSQWICLLYAVDVVEKHRTIQFTVTCVTITFVQKTVTLRNMQDHGRSIDCIILISSQVKGRISFLVQSIPYTLLPFDILSIVHCNPRIVHVILVLVRYTVKIVHQLLWDLLILSSFCILNCWTRFSLTLRNWTNTWTMWTIFEEKELCS